MEVRVWELKRRRGEESLNREDMVQGVPSSTQQKASACFILILVGVLAHWFAVAAEGAVAREGGDAASTCLTHRGGSFTTGRGPDLEKEVSSFFSLSPSFVSVMSNCRCQYIEGSGYPLSRNRRKGVAIFEIAVTTMTSRK